MAATEEKTLLTKLVLRSRFSRCFVWCVAKSEQQGVHLSAKRECIPFFFPSLLFFGPSFGNEYYEPRCRCIRARLVLQMAYVCSCHVCLSVRQSYCSSFLLKGTLIRRSMRPGNVAGWEGIQNIITC